MDQLKIKTIHKVDKARLLEQKIILNSDISVLLSKYFLCEKLSKDLCTNLKNNEKLHLGTLKSAIKSRNLNISTKSLDLLFLSSLNNRKEKSFRVIRNYICHSCSIKYRDFAIKNKAFFNKLLDDYLEELFKIFSL